MKIENNLLIYFKLNINNFQFILQNFTNFENSLIISELV